MEKKQTAVEWLIDQVEDFIGLIPIDIIAQAKAMEKQQQKLFFECGRQYQLTGEGTFTQVHNETFKSDGKKIF